MYDSRTPVGFVSNETSMAVTVCAPLESNENPRMAFADTELFDPASNGLAANPPVSGLRVAVRVVVVPSAVGGVVVL